MTARTVRRLAGASLVAVLVAACGAADQQEAKPRIVSAGIVKDGDVVPAPHGEVVLMARGEGLRRNVAEGVAFDLASLDALPTVEVAIDDPWENRNVQYRGVLMSNFLVAIGAPASAQNIEFTALDDYEVTLTTAELRSGSVLIATRADGNLLAVKEGGPTKIVFLPSSKVGKNKDLWIWSIKDLVVQ